MRCKITGCNLDDCGVCRRCGSEAKSEHAWKEIEREKECFGLKVCERCGKRHETPDHDWAPTGGSVAGDIELRCSRCGLAI
ncbi:MAG: hypothetical protein ACYTG4_15925 [Planctomycetota bacterium]